MFLRWYAGRDDLVQPVWNQVRARFASETHATPMAGWGRLFWGLLLANPLLRESEPAEGVGLPGLGRLPRGPRALLLLHLVAGLDDDDAAEVLNVGPETFRKALQHNMPRLHDGQPDEESWRIVRQRIAAELRGDAGTARPAPTRSVAEAPALRRTPEEPPAPRRWRNPALAAAALLTLAALALTFIDTGALLDPEPPVPPGALGEARIQVQPLAAGPLPAPAPDGDSALLLDPDYELLAAGIPREQLDTLAFDAWHAAQLAIASEAVLTPDEPNLTPPLPIDAETPPGSSETHDEPL